MLRAQADGIYSCQDKLSNFTIFTNVETKYPSPRMSNPQKANMKISHSNQFSKNKIYQIPENLCTKLENFHCNKGHFHSYSLLSSLLFFIAAYSWLPKIVFLFRIDQFMCRMTYWTLFMYKLFCKNLKYSKKSSDEIKWTLKLQL